MIKDRNLEPGDVLIARYQEQDYACKVFETADGLRYGLHDGTVHMSPSDAGSAAMGGVACNGSVFWSLATPGAPMPRFLARRVGPQRRLPRLPGL